MSRYSKEDVHANWINKKIHLAEEYSLRCIDIIENETNTDVDKLEYRDAYYDIIKLLNSDTSIGHAICLVGLRRTGKTVLLNQIKNSSAKYNITKDEIIHLSLFTLIDGNAVDRNNLDMIKIGNGKEIRYPCLNDIKSLIEIIMSYSKIKLVIIDEITLCEDLILCSKGFLDWMFNNGIKVLLAGTESASFLLANDNSLYTRAILKDVSYIPFGEYCRLKRLKVSTYAEKRIAFDKYIKYGNILDDTIEIDEKYIQSAVGVNLALSIINSDNTRFIEFDNNVKALVQNIIKYFKLLGEKINLSAINSDISRATISNAINNVNKRRTNDKINISKFTRNQLAIDSAEQFFKNYSLKLTKSTVTLMSQHLDDIDNIFNNMGMIYSLTKIPYIDNNNAIEADDVHLLHCLLYNLGDKLADDFKTANLNLSDADILDIYDNIKNRC